MLEPQLAAHVLYIHSAARFRFRLPANLFPTGIFDLCADKQLAKDFLCKPFHLVDLTQTSDTQIKKFGLAAIVALIQKNIFSKDILPAVKLLAKWGAFTEADREQLVGYIVSMVNYITACAETDELNTLMGKLEQAFSNKSKTKEAIVTIREQLERVGERRGVKKGIERGRREGIERGRREGIERGRREIKRQMAMDMMAAGESDMKIRQYTKLSQREIDQLKAE